MSGFRSWHVRVCARCSGVWQEWWSGWDSIVSKRVHMKCLVLSSGPGSCRFSLIKPSILFVNHWSCVFRFTCVYPQPLSATYALKSKD